MAATRDVLTSHYSVRVTVERTDKVTYPRGYGSRDEAVIPMDEVFEEVSFKIEQDGDVNRAVAVAIDMLKLQYPSEKLA